MAEIYTCDGEEITVGLQGSAVCDEALRAARSIARDRNEPVRLEDDGELWDVHPDGRCVPGECWDSPDEYVVSHAT